MLHTAAEGGNRDQGVTTGGRGCLSNLGGGRFHRKFHAIWARFSVSIELTELHETSRFYPPASLTQIRTIAALAVAAATIALAAAGLAISLPLTLPLPLTPTLPLARLVPSSPLSRRSRLWRGSTSSPTRASVTRSAASSATHARRSSDPQQQVHDRRPPGHQQARHQPARPQQPECCGHRPHAGPGQVLPGQHGRVWRQRAQRRPAQPLQAHDELHVLRWGRAGQDRAPAPRPHTLERAADQPLAPDEPRAEGRSRPTRSSGSSRRSRTRRSPSSSTARRVSAMPRR